MKTAICLIMLMALAYCVEGRQRLGKVSKRQARQREYKAIQNPQSGVIPQSVVLNSFGQSQAPNQAAATPRQAAQINIPLAPPAYPAQPIGQQPQYQQATGQGTQQQYQQPLVQQAQYQQPQPLVPQQQYQQQRVSPVGYQQPQPLQPYQPVQPQAQYHQLPQPAIPQETPYNPLIQNVLQSRPAYSQPIAIVKTPGYILSKLPSNASLIRSNIVDGFSCSGRPYGYYADVINECQIFHVCYPLKSVFNNDPNVPDATYDFSFICNEFTRFSQDSMTCAWQFEAVPCEVSEQLYSLNDNFFKITTPASIPGSGYGNAAAPLPGSSPLTGTYPATGR